MKTGTKLTSLVLALLMLISVFSAAPMTAGAATSGGNRNEVMGDGASDASSDFIVYYKNNMNWDRLLRFYLLMI